MTAGLRAALCLGLVGLLSASFARPPMVRADEQAEGLAFFEQKIRPVLVEHCYECHSAGAKHLKGGLQLDSRQGLLKGGDSGPALVPKNAADSLLLQALKYDGVEMPPKGRLPAEVVANFERWISLGAPDPREGKVAERGKIDIEQGRKFWAYRPVANPPLPAVADASWPQGNIDRFVLARLEQARLQPVADAEARTLVRRLYFDLTGLPPTAAELDAFAAADPAAYEALVDKLLASPRFGERWGRHWLDVARYAESLTLRGFILPAAWRYRDYVIESFNEDRPFNQFVREQVAGDLLPADTLAEKQRNRVAVAFLALGNNNLEEQDKKQLRMDVVDEQLDTLGKAFLAQTLGCARCHDHKFDPIPTRDYYALAGILRNTRTLHHANVSMWLEAPYPLPPAEDQVFRDYEEQVTSLDLRVHSARHAMSRAMAEADGQHPDATPDALAVTELAGVVVDDTQAKAVGSWRTSKHYPRFIGSGYVSDDNKDKGAKTLTFTPDLPKTGKYEVRLAYTSDPHRAAAVPVTIFSADGEHTIHVNMREAPDIDGRFVSLGTYQFEGNGQGFVIVSNEGTEGYVTPDAVQFLPAETSDSLFKRAKAKFADALPEPVRQASEQLKELEKELAAAKKAAPQRPKVLTIEEEPQIEETHVHVRGNVHNQGDPAPRGFLQVASYDQPPEFSSDQSGRRQLGEWLASPHNPLTARVMVNRVWHWLFGAGLVRTVDNFGASGELPSHGALLDYLAQRFVAEGWSVKRLVREIVLSRTYRLSSANSPACAAADPENRLLWRSNRRRLDADALRDALLLVSGDLDLDAHGSLLPGDLKSDFGYKSAATVRSVYLPVLRNALPEMLEVFDAADPSMVTGRRSASTVAPQALFLVNHPWVREQAAHAAARLLGSMPEGQPAQIRWAFVSTFGREPSAAEQQHTEKYLTALTSGEEKLPLEAAWGRVFQALFAAIDFRFID